MQDFTEIRSMMGTLRTVIRAMKEGRLSGGDVKNVEMTAEEINRMLYHSKRLKFQGEYGMDVEKGHSAYAEEVERLMGLWEQSMSRRQGKSADIQFWETYEYFKYVDVDTIYMDVVRHFMGLPEGQRIEYLSLPHRYSFLQNRIDFTKGDFSLIAEYVELMAGHVEDFRWLYGRLEDYRSKMALNGIVSYWFGFELQGLSRLCENMFEDYYDLDVLKCGEEDVLVDLGAYTGDSVFGYMRAYGSYKRIYAYEMTPSTYETLEGNLSRFPNVVLRQKGVGKKSGVMYTSDVKNGAGNKLSEKGDTAVEVVTLDEDIKEPVTVVKMDIEGAEADALLGAEKHIRADRPRLLVSVYHKPGDIFKIPRLIDGIRQDYKLYLRFNGCGCLWPCDYVLLAV